jgi:hypothetical protein
MMGWVSALAFVVLGALGAASAGAAGEFAGPPPARGLVIRADWQEPQVLPPRFRNHCATDTFSSRPYCSNHCGADYQFYYCSDAAFGCCRLGRGYCDWRGHLRCHP